MTTPSSEFREGVAEIPGASLRYRLTGTPSRLPLVVLENGWSGSYDYFALLQNELAPHTRVLLYNRAGIGGSKAHEPQSAEGMSRHLAALLDNLGIAEPVVIAGQSYGGLICGVHAASIPQRIRAVVQIDPTAERPDPLLDGTGGAFRIVARLMVVLATLGFPVAAIAGRAPELPPADARQLARNALSNAASLRAAIVEMELLPSIRDVCARSSPTPRLVISADKSEELTGLVKLILPSGRPQAVLSLMQAQHKVTAGRGGKGSQWISLPHTHGGLVMTRRGASATTIALIEYISGLQATSL